MISTIGLIQRTIMWRRLGIVGPLGAALSLWIACGPGVPPGATVSNRPRTLHIMELLPIGAGDKPLPRVTVAFGPTPAEIPRSDEPRIVAILSEADFDRVDRRIQILSRSEISADLERAGFGSYEVRFAEDTGRQPMLLDPPAARLIIGEIRSSVDPTGPRQRLDELLRRLDGHATGPARP